jgi:ribosomal protein S12 methylthiotransferase accessory factor
MRGHPRPLGDAVVGDGRRAQTRGAARPEAWLTAVAAAIGVTRVARLTGLDRTGVEVASAVRPGGHVLQVSNGKGATFEDAARGAVMEAAELWAAEQIVPGPAGDAAAVRTAFPDAEVIGAGELAPDGGSATDALVLTWSAGALVGDVRRALVPAHAVSCPPPAAPLLGVAAVPWTSNGLGAHPQRDAAILHALLEVVERDALARSLPAGFTAQALAERLVDPATLTRTAPRAAALVAGLRARGLRPYLVDATGAAGLPVAAALLVDPELPAVPLAAGYACRLDRDAALAAALLEACQSRATEIHGAREDVDAGDRDGAAPLVAMLATTRPRRSARALPSLAAAPDAAAVRLVARRLAAAGAPRVAVVDLPSPAGVSVVKVLAPGLLVSELLLG